MPVELLAVRETDMQLPSKRGPICRTPPRDRTQARCCQCACTPLPASVDTRGAPGYSCTWPYEGPTRPVELAEYREKPEEVCQ